MMKKLTDIKNTISPEMAEWNRRCESMHDEDARWNWSLFHLVHQYHELLAKEIDRRLIENNLPSFSRFMILVSISTIQHHPTLSVASDGKTTGRAVAKFLMCTEASISRLVNRLSDEGFITITRDEARRSANILVLTKTGSAGLEGGMSLITNILNENLSHIPKKDRTILQVNLAQAVLKLDPTQQVLCGLNAELVANMAKK